MSESPDLFTNNMANIHVKYMPDGLQGTLEVGRFGTLPGELRMPFGNIRLQQVGAIEVSWKHN